MKFSMILDDNLINQAMKLSGIKQKTAVIHRGLDELIKKYMRERLIALGGFDSKAKAAPRMRSRQRNKS